MKNNIDISKFGTGAVVGNVDPRDYQYSEIGHASTPFDWAKGYDIQQELIKLGVKLPNNKIPVKDQNGSSSCGGQAWSYYGAVLEAVATKTFEERSAKFIYAQTFHTPGGGSIARDNSEVLRTQGVAREALCRSYDKGFAPSEAFMVRPQDITPEAKNDAKKAITPAYALVNITMDSIAQALRDNYGVVIGVNGQNNGTWGSSFPQPPNKTEWRHWVYVGNAKLINGVKHIGILNSWGEGIGDGGRQWLSEAYISQIWLATTHVIPVPPPEPEFSYNWKYNLEYGAKGDDVVALQKAMQILGYFPKGLPCTGAYLDITRRAVLKMQTEEHIGTLSEVITLQGRRVGNKTRAYLNSKFK